MRIRLFWQLVIAFVILIVTGIGGTMSLIGVTFRQIYTHNLPSALLSVEDSWTASLADYYVAHGNSWAGVQGRLDTMLEQGEWFPVSSMGMCCPHPTARLSRNAATARCRGCSSTWRCRREARSWLARPRSDA